MILSTLNLLYCLSHLINLRIPNILQAFYYFFKLTFKPSSSLELLFFLLEFCVGNDFLIC